MVLQKNLIKPPIGPTECTSRRHYQKISKDLDTNLEISIQFYRNLHLRINKKKVIKTKSMSLEGLHKSANNSIALKLDLSIAPSNQADKMTDLGFRNRSNFEIFLEPSSQSILTFTSLSLLAKQCGLLSPEFRCACKTGILGSLNQKFVHCSWHSIHSIFLGCRHQLSSKPPGLPPFVQGDHVNLQQPRSNDPLHSSIKTPG